MDRRLSQSALILGWRLTPRAKRPIATTSKRSMAMAQELSFGMHLCVVANWGDWRPVEQVFGLVLRLGIERVLVATTPVHGKPGESPRTRRPMAVTPADRV